MKPARPNTNAYLQTKVMTANPVELRLMLFDGAIRFARQAREDLAGRKWEGAFTNATRCQQILLELTNSLRPEQNSELCKNLSSLYTFMYSRLVTAGTERDPALIDEVLKLLEFERETWAMLLEQLAQENKSAANAMEVPDAQPTLPSGTSSAHALIGGTVSLRG